MYTIKGVKAVIEQTTEQLCGRLIVWDVGTPYENFVMLEMNYRPTKYDLSPEIELKPYEPSNKNCDPAARSVAAINKVLKRFNLVRDFDPKKSWLN